VLPEEACRIVDASSFAPPRIIEIDPQLVFR
jgi:hypothetical protein